MASRVGRLYQVTRVGKWYLAMKFIQLKQCEIENFFPCQDESQSIHVSSAFIVWRVSHWDGGLLRRIIWWKKVTWSLCFWCGVGSHPLLLSPVLLVGETVDSVSVSGASPAFFDICKMKSSQQTASLIADTISQFHWTSVPCEIQIKYEMRASTSESHQLSYLSQLKVETIPKLGNLLFKYSSSLEL